MMILSLTEVAKILNCSAPKLDCSLQGVCHDSRRIKPGNLYVAIQGERYDGHDFINDALQQGAAAALVTREINAPIPQLIVSDTIHALGILSAHWRNQFNIPLIGVTGSNGKTTLKNMIASILTAACDGQSDSVLATEGNLNNNIGVPLMLLRLNSNHRYAVIEMGMNHLNEISYLTHLAKPTVAIVNNAGPSHLEGVKNLDGVAKAKGEIFQGLSKQGTAILNRDDHYFSYWKELIGHQSYLSFGLHEKADIRVTHQQDSTVTIQTPSESFNLTLPLLGIHNVMNALAATAATFAINIPSHTIKKGLEQVKPAPGRMHAFTLNNGTHIIDDTYNASPASLLAAASTLSHYSGTKILVLGDMKELGDETHQLHFTSGEKIKALGIDYLFTLGELSAETSRGFGHNANHFTQRDALAHALQPHLNEQTTILFKGSRSMQMEKIIALIAPEHTLEHAH